MRTTKQQVQSAFENLCKAMGKRVAKSYDDHGAWSLDHNATYGGYVIEQIGDTTCGVSHPFTSSRLPAGEFWNACWFATRAVEAVKESASVAA